MVERPLQNGQKDRAHRGEPKKATAYRRQPRPLLVRSPESLLGKASTSYFLLPSVTLSVRGRPSIGGLPASLPFSLPWSFFSPPPSVRSVARLHGTGFVPRGLARSFPLSSLPKLHVQFHLQDGTPTRKVLASFVATCESEKSVNNPTEG